MLKFNGMVSATISKQLRATPTQPGVYLLKDSRGQVLYVGKAASLRHRLQSYFGSPSSQDPKIHNLVAIVRDFEFIVTESEAEALILENTLIKKQKPKYNARLKDDKTYPYLKIGINEDFPQVYITPPGVKRRRPLLWPLRQRRLRAQDHEPAEEAVSLSLLH